MKCENIDRIDRRLDKCRWDMWLFSSRRYRIVYEMVGKLLENYRRTKYFY